MNITKTENLLLKQFELQPAGAEDKHHVFPRLLVPAERLWACDLTIAQPQKYRANKPSPHGASIGRPGTASAETCLARDLSARVKTLLPPAATLMG